MEQVTLRIRQAQHEWEIGSEDAAPRMAINWYTSDG